jgi:SAM-dependent methyltransferase
MTISDFDRQFARVLGFSRRWQAFRLIAEELIQKGRPVHILETGCARQTDNWDGDGQSTLVWDFLINALGGSAVSFDISPQSVEYAKSRVSKAEVRCIDSVIGLRQYQHVELLDLVYLDSYDLTDGIESPTHHLAELTSIYPRLPSGCLIAVDDCVNEQHGKHRFVRDWLSTLGLEPLVRSYITVWRKP